MKVLWFSNTPAGGNEILKAGGTRGGWLSSLDKALCDKVKLSVAFYFARFAEPFTHNGVSYFPICKKNWKLNIIRKNLFGGFIDQEDLSIYLDIINRVQPDIIHIHGSENPFGCIVGKTDIHVVLSIQGICTVYTHKYFSGIESRYASLNNKDFRSPYTWIFNKSYNYQYRNVFLRYPKIEQRSLADCKYIIGRTDWDRRVSRILAPKSVYFHNDEILRDPFYQNEWNYHNNRKIVIHSTIGETLFKGFETICQTVHELKKIGIDAEWRVAGITERDLLNKVVKKRLKDTYPGSGLVLLGNLYEHDLVDKMLEADIFVMPSHIENSPNSLCEAMILGMPCITTLAGGSSSLLKDKEEGLVIQDGDPWSMAGAIMELHHNPEIAAYYGSNARKRAMFRHNPSKIVSDLLDIYHQIGDKNEISL
jgi:glycosyltransferase involved in cell wall biosynthesis